jgi:MATE family multidrug resistance protein
MTRVFLPWLYLSPLISVWCFLLDGIFIGATRGAEMRDTMLFAALGVFIPVWWLLQPLGNHGLWLAFMLFFAARGAGLGWYYLRIQGRSGFVAGA